MSKLYSYSYEYSYLKFPNRVCANEAFFGQAVHDRDGKILRQPRKHSTSSGTTGRGKVRVPTD
eukprot:scaffold131910_cov35-Prasinocladus_malaysianus.AAC.1